MQYYAQRASMVSFIYRSYCRSLGVTAPLLSSCTHSFYVSMNDNQTMLATQYLTGFGENFDTS